MPAHMTIILPGLPGPAADNPQVAAADRSLTALETLLSRADRRAGVAGPVESLLFSAFGHGTAGDELPVAAVSRVADMGSESDGWWLRVDPVHLRPDRDTLVFMGGDGLGLSDEEAAQLVRELDQVFLPHGWHLHMGTAQRWYLRLPEDPRIHTRMPSLMVGRDIRAYLPSGEQAALWHVVMNEAQMQLHMSSVNHRREALGFPVVNSVWIWGGGRTPRLPASWDHVWCDHVVGRGLTALSEGDIVLHNVPGSGSEWLTQAGAGGAHLVVLDGADTPDLQAWRSALQRINDHWIVPLRGALQDGAVGRLTLISGTGADFTLTPSACRRWWRRTRRLHAHFQFERDKRPRESRK